MSLHVYLHNPQAVRTTGSGIFVRENGQTREITRDEWDSKFPNMEPCVAAEPDNSWPCYSANVTDNLGLMAQEAGLYEPVWWPDEIGITEARQMIEPLRAGIALLESDPDRFKAFNPPNGWGSYEGFVPWLREYLAACEASPDAKVSVSR